MKTEYVLGFRFDEDFRNVLLVRKNRPAWQKGKYNGIGGKVEDKDTTPTHAMVREFKEECGIKTEVDEWTYRGRMTGSFGTVFIYRSVGDISKFASMTDEQIEKVPINDIVTITPNEVIHNVKTVITALLDEQFFLMDFVYS